MAGTITIRVNDMEEKILDQVADVYGLGKSSLIKQLAFEKLEDEYDLKLIEEYEKKEAAGKLKTKPVDELWKDLEL